MIPTSDHHVTLDHYSDREFCGAKVQTINAEFSITIGVFLTQFQREVNRYLCKNCVDSFFGDFSGKMILLGWWGLFSFVEISEEIGAVLGFHNYRKCFEICNYS